MDEAIGNKLEDGTKPGFQRPEISLGQKKGPERAELPYKASLFFSFFLSLLLLLFFCRCLHCDWRRKWQPTPVFLPGESHGQRSLAGYSPWVCKELDMTEATEDTRICYEPKGRENCPALPTASPGARPGPIALLDDAGIVQTCRG